VNGAVTAGGKPRAGPLNKTNGRFIFWDVRKGEQTRGAILERAISLASELGLNGVTIGRLAEELDLSKSGLFAHFESKDALLVQMLERAAERFAEVVIQPALAMPRGEPRVRALFQRWLGWPQAVRQPGGCLFVAAAVELDDRPGPARDRLVQLQRDWLRTLATATRLAQNEGHFREDLDPEQFAFELQAILLGFHHSSRLLRDPKATERANRAFEQLLVRARVRR
jgi:AcrR family transcriptional regulator